MDNPNQCFKFTLQEGAVVPLNQSGTTFKELSIMDGPKALEHKQPPQSMEYQIADYTPKSISVRDAAIIVDFDSQPNNVNHPPFGFETMLIQIQTSWYVST